MLLIEGLTLKLIDEIIETLSTESGKLSEALFKTKVLLHKVGHKELVPWVNNELNGYPDMDSVPDYRVLSAQVLVNASNGAYRATAHHIPMGHLEEEFRTSLKTARMDQSLAVLERFSENEEGRLQAHIPMEAYGLLGKGLGNGYQIEEAWTEISNDAVLQILTQVRSRLLDFTLELKDQFPDELTEQEVKQKINKVDTESLFNNAIFGDNTTILLGNGNAQTVSNKNIKKNIKALVEKLTSEGISEESANEVAEIVSSEEATSVDEPLGKKARQWMIDNLKKAEDGSWKVGISVATDVLKNAVKQYYGI